MALGGRAWTWLIYLPCTVRTGGWVPHRPAAAASCRQRSLPFLLRSTSAAAPPARRSTGPCLL